MTQNQSTNATVNDMRELVFSSAFKKGVGRASADVEAHCEVPWNTEWFASPSSKFNMDLAVASIGLAMSSARNSKKNGCKYVTASLEALGFSDVDATAFNHRSEEDPSDFDKNPDLAAYAIAHQTVRDTSGNPTHLVAFVIRGTSHTKEWESNANVANGVTDGNYNVEYHEGFDAAADEAFGHLAQYMAHHGISPHDAAIWICGHSRGAAIANLIGGFMCESEEFDRNRVFVYTFATPAPTRRKDAHSTAFEGIFNIIDPEDYVPRMPLESWGFTRFGNTLCLPVSAFGNPDAAEYFQLATNLFQEFTGTVRPSFSGIGPVLNMQHGTAAIAPTLDAAYTQPRLTKLGRMTLDKYYSEFVGGSGHKGVRFLQNVLKLGKAAFGPFGEFVNFFAKYDFLDHSVGGAHSEEGYLARMTAAQKTGFGPFSPDSDEAKTVAFTVYGEVDLELLDASGKQLASVWQGKIEKSQYPVYFDGDTLASTVWLPWPGGMLDFLHGYKMNLRDRRGHSFGVTIAEQDAMGNTLQQYEYGPLKIGAGHTLSWEELASGKQPNHTAHGNNLNVTVRAVGAKRCDAVGAQCLTAGDWACVHAFEGFGATFKGWFEEGRNPKVAKPESTSRSYRMRVVENRNLVAVFE